MDTTKVVLQKDTLISSEDSLGTKLKEFKSVESITIKEPDSLFNSFCNCTLIGSLIWPIILFAITLIFYKQIRSLISDIGERIKNGDNFKIGPSGFEISEAMNKEDVKSKAENDYKETIQNVENSEQTISKEEYVPKYLEIEREIFNVFLKALYPTYRILSNRSLQGSEFDLIIETLGNKEYDYIAEIKYFPHRINKSNVRKITLQLEFLKQVYQNTTGRKAKPILIIVLGDEININDNLEIFDFINQPFVDKKQIKAVMINRNDIKNLNRLRIIDILEYNE